MATDWVRAAEELVEELLEPNAAEVDRTGRIPDAHFDALAERGFHGFLLSEGMTPEILINTVATVISGCLATGFVWAQHLGAVRAVAFGDNADLRDRFLPRMTRGDYRCGVSYAGARTRPTLFAEPTDTGYLLSGTAPFVTGWDYIDAVAAAVRIRSGDDESVATLLLPTDRLDGVSAERIPLIAADASATVQLRFDRTPVTADHLITSKPHARFSSDRGSLTDWVNGALSLGVLMRCVRQLDDSNIDPEPYRHRLTSLRTQYATAATDPRAVYALRAETAHTALTTAAAAVVATGSRATRSGSTPERLTREATFALVCTTRDPIKHALLDRLEP
ncbi:acyl-CoA/acyl-ACP dehydrogenase [Nocardia sp. CDC159]|uniref:Acyl-CoA/acyl-ACP dehydrogenase n=1 Tax=Nocardia pulmonis TaxID=2951408 RepID=A0A9X2E3J3_9NOCA|nr:MULTISPECIES: acyl-CoA dehydrogenase family protein [Nocardia]MCM6773607.1 acyl-CoA/acyl-ACP dehydrogenase [Nocardia pulmonis]MCM6786494.1 acyl-CoA/acyl-ACP dehydrogenase [Nocardia sp. CDC159]